MTCRIERDLGQLSEHTAATLRHALGRPVEKVGHTELAERFEVRLDDPPSRRVIRYHRSECQHCPTPDEVIDTEDLDDDLLDLVDPHHSVSNVESSADRRPRAKAPSGFEPGHEWDGEEGYIALPPRTEDEGAPDNDTWARVMRELNLDPEDVRIVGTPRVSSWDSGHKRLWAYKAKIERLPEDRESLPHLLDAVDGWERVPAPTLWIPDRLPDDAPEVYQIVNLADWQVGKGEGDGTPGTVARVRELREQVVRAKAMYHALGYRVVGLYVVGLGDIVEGCKGWYSGQEFKIDLTRREQITLVVRLLLELLKAWADHYPEIVVAAVGGNHGENRGGNRGNKGGGITDVSDNSDVGVFELASIAASENPDLRDLVRWHLPKDELMITLSIGDTGIIHSWTHGHLSGRGRPPKSHWKWWKDQWGGASRNESASVADADVLTVGHFHHFITYQPNDARTLIQCPAMDGGSKHFKDRKGDQSAPGTVTYAIGPDGIVDNIVRVLPARTFASN